MSIEASISALQTSSSLIRAHSIENFFSKVSRMDDGQEVDGVLKNNCGSIR
jgi:hypothetical protein